VDSDGRARAAAAPHAAAAAAAAAPAIAAAAAAAVAATAAAAAPPFGRAERRARRVQTQARCPLLRQRAQEEALDEQDGGMVSVRWERVSPRTLDDLDKVTVSLSPGSALQGESL
jgi:hypothetical protein